MVGVMIGVIVVTGCVVGVDGVDGACDCAVVVVRVDRIVVGGSSYVVLGVCCFVSVVYMVLS